MVRTQIQLTEAQVAGLKQLAGQRQLSIAEIIRQAVDQVLQDAGAAQGNWEEKKRRALSVVGKFQSGLSDISEHHDAYLDEAYDYFHSESATAQS
jgi:hypothetical protein